MKKTDISQLRTDYTGEPLDEGTLAADPREQFSKWWAQAHENVPEANAMTLATVNPDGHADARIVLLKAFDETGFIFYTNYNSTKGKQIDNNPNVCLLLYWKELERQVRITGAATKIGAAESVKYFDSRPDKSKIGAWASPQSAVVAGKAWLTETFHYYAEQFKQGHIPKPPHWGGYRVVPTRIEFWQGRPNRMHDRILYTPEGDQWKIERLAP